MKILKIFGAVMAVHAFAFILIFANPGCSSTNKPAAAATPESTAPAPTSVGLPPSSSGYVAGGSPLSAADPAAAPSISFDPNAPAISNAVRYSPTRPGTPAAATLEAKPVADVTPAATYTVANGDNLWNLAKKNHLTAGELAKVNNLPANAKLKPGQKLIIPGKSTGGVAAAAAPATTYRVKNGETLAGIARQNGTTTAALRQLNGLKSDTVHAGYELKLPAGTVASSEASAVAAPSAGKAANGSVTHVVKPGETLSSIAQKYQVKYSEIATANSITDPGKVRAGMTLVIPGWQAPKSAKAVDLTAKSAPEAPPVLNIPSAGPEAGAASQPATDVPVIKVEDSGATSGNR